MWDLKILGALGSHQPPPGPALELPSNGHSDYHFRVESGEASDRERSLIEILMPTLLIPQFFWTRGPLKMKDQPNRTVHKDVRPNK
jgi:hypothetical protein